MSKCGRIAMSSRDIKCVGVLGAGLMGSEVALDLACYGYRVLLKDISLDRLHAAEVKIKSDFKLIKMMKKERQIPTIDEILQHILFTDSYDNFDEADVLVENVTEDWDVKHGVYLDLRERCKADALYAANTSCISITKIAAVMPQPERVIGMHFMNPVPLKDLVEVIRGYHTSDETVARSEAFLRSIGKKAVVVSDAPGFVSNRLSHLFMNEAAFLVQEQVATPKQIDLIFKRGYGHKMGPCETADLIGIDTVVRSLDILYESFHDPKFRSCPLLRKMADAGLLGKKSRKGFYEYDIAGTVQ